MAEKDNLNHTAEPEAKEQKTESTISQEITVPVKFNGQIKNLTVDEASLLAQKGMKFDLIKEDFETLKNLAKRKNKSIPEYLQALKQGEIDSRKNELLEKCNGDAELAEKITELEEKQNGSELDSFDEVRRFFPKIENKDSLPQEVVESSNLKGTLLLDEYLRYLLAQKRRQEKSIKSKEAAEKSSVGSQLSRKNSLSPESEEFIKGLWK